MLICLSINAKSFSSTGIPTRYHVSGVIQLPYAEINEPFESWIDVDAGFSRIDYYGGAAKTIQRQGNTDNDFGANFKIVPISSKRFICFQTID